MTEKIVGNWILEAAIASGGMGSVYRARHKTLGNTAAVKVLQPQLVETEEMRQRFAREAAIQAGLQHPNIARVLDYHEQEGRWYLVMELLDHGSLSDRLREANGPVPVEQAVAWIGQALAGIHFAHQHGIVHRDIKPENLLFDGHGQVKVADFGIARDLNVTRMTQAGMTMGTPHYMSPEQLMTPDQVDERSDVYALGVVLYEMLAGRTPYEGSSFFAISQAKVHTDPPALAGLQPAVPASLAAIVHRAMARDPGERYASCLAFGQDLEAFVAGRATGPSPLPVVAGSAIPVPAIPVPAATRMQPVSDFQPVPAAGSPGRGWKVATAGLFLLAVLAAALVWTFGIVSQGPAADSEALGKAVQEALIAEESAKAVDEVGEQVGAIAEQAESTVHEVLTKPSLDTGQGKVGAAQGLVEQARKQWEASQEIADQVDEAHRGARKAALEGGVDLEEPASEKPVLVAVLPRSAERAKRAVRDAVEVARRASARAREVVGDADAAILRVEGQIGEAKDQLAALVPEIPDLRNASDFDQAQLAALQQGQGSGLDQARLAALKGSPGFGTGEGSGQVLGRGLGGRPGFPLGPLPLQPTVAVLAHGEPVMAASFEQELERRLTRAKLDVRDEHNSLAVSRRLQGGRAPEAEELAPELLQSGFHVLVLITVEEGQRRTLDFRGQSGSAMGARLRVNAYNLVSRAPIGRGWSELMEYTELSAGALAKRALLKESSELAVAIREAWQQVSSS